MSLFTREQGRVKGVARHAMRSRRRFGGALEPMTHVRATWAERPKQDLVRLDAFEILSSPMSGPVDYARVAALEFVAEVIEEAMPEGAPEDAVFRLAVAALNEMQVGRVWMPVTYFALWMSRLMGWMPELGRCSVCGLDAPRRCGRRYCVVLGGGVWGKMRGRQPAGEHCSVRGECGCCCSGCFARRWRNWPRMTGRRNARRTCGASRSSCWNGIWREG